MDGEWSNELRNERNIERRARFVVANMRKTCNPEI